MKFQFVPELVKTDLEAVNQKEAITSLVTLLRKEGCVQDDYAGLVLEREQQYPTGLQTKGAAIAMPHAFDERIKDSHVAIGILKDAVSFHNMEDMEESLNVHIIFLLAVGQAHEQLEMLKILMGLFQEETMLQKMLATHSSQASCDMLNGYVQQQA